MDTHWCGWCLLLCLMIALTIHPVSSFSVSSVVPIPDDTGYGGDLSLREDTASRLIASPPERAPSAAIVNRNHSESSVHGAVQGSPFPRLGMWWLDVDSATPQQMARYDLLLNEFDDPEYVQKLRQVRACNDDILVFRPISPSEQSWYLEGPNPVIKNLPTGFFVTTLGTRLAEPVTRNQRTIRVRSLIQPDGSPKFSVGGTIVIGQHESAKVLAIDTKHRILTLKRGFIRPASSHRAGEYVASHVTFWPGSWVMNVAATCPRVNVPWINRKVNWIELYHSLLRTRNIPGLSWNGEYINQAGAKYDGFVIDRFEDRESWLVEGRDGGTLLDLHHNNTRVSRVAFDRSWQRGVDRFTAMLRQSFPGLPLIRNNPISLRSSAYDGQVYEESGWSHPRVSWWQDYFMRTNTGSYYRNLCYLDWFRTGTRPRYVMIEVYQDESFPGEPAGEGHSRSLTSGTPDYKRMRFSLTSALLGDGYYSYERSTSTHGSGGLYWFDEYTAGKGKGYLGYPSGQAVRLPSGAYQREFDNGLVLVNPRPSPVTIPLSRELRKIKGTQVPSVNTGALVSQVSLAAWDGIILLNP